MILGVMRFFYVQLLQQRPQENYSNEKFDKYVQNYVAQTILNRFTHTRNPFQILGDFWSTLCISLQTQNPKHQIYTSENIMLVIYPNQAEPHQGFFSPCLQSYSLVRKTSNLHLTILFNQCWNLSIQIYFDMIWPIFLL